MTQRGEWATARIGSSSQAFPRGRPNRRSRLSLEQISYDLKRNGVRPPRHQPGWSHSQHRGEDLLLIAASIRGGGFRSRGRRPEGPCAAPQMRPGADAPLGSALRATNVPRAPGARQAPWRDLEWRPQQTGFINGPRRARTGLQPRSGRFSSRPGRRRRGRPGSRGGCGRASRPGRGRPRARPRRT
jgi:hypothetical protein